MAEFIKIKGTGFGNGRHLYLGNINQRVNIQTDSWLYNSVYFILAVFYILLSNPFSGTYIRPKQILVKY